MLVASLTRMEALLVPDARAAAAVEAAVSAAPCIVRFVRYQFAASVPIAANPTTAGRDSAINTVAPPARSERSFANRRTIERNRRCFAGLVATVNLSIASPQIG